MLNGFGITQTELWEKINKELQSILERQTDPCGIKVSMVEIKHVDLPEEMKRVMARQAEAERERRAKFKLPGRCQMRQRS